MLKRILLTAIIGIFAICVQGQSTEFTYQGILKDGADPANGNYDLEFRLYDAAVDGAQIGATASHPNVAIVDGLVSATLDFGPGFPGADRFLEIRIRSTGGGGFTILDPRQKVASSPYSIRSLDTENAEQLGGVDANNYLQTNGSGANLTDLNAASITTGVLPASRGGTGVPGVGPNGTFLRSNGSAWAISGLQAIDIPQGSTNYIRNSGAEQAGSQFNISGTGRADIFRATTQFSIGSNRVLSASGVGNIFAGIQAGNTGTNNSFVGGGAGANNTTGGNNTFIGATAGGQNTTGNDNTFVGVNTGFGNSMGRNNTLIGFDANVSSDNFIFATAIGSDAVVTASNRIQLGRNGFDTVNVGVLASASATPLCVNIRVLASCSSSRRYKKNIANFTAGLDLVNRLRPVTFDWAERDEPDLGLIAEEVEEAEPLLATYNDKGEIEGVKYRQLSIVLINAIKEQQAQIDVQQKEIAERKATEQRLQSQIDGLRTIVCASSPDADGCDESNHDITRNGTKQ